MSVFDAGFSSTFSEIQSVTFQPLLPNIIVKVLRLAERTRCTVLNQTTLTTGSALASIRVFLKLTLDNTSKVTIPYYIINPG